MALTRKEEVVILDVKQTTTENQQNLSCPALTTTGHALTKSQKRKHPEHVESLVQPEPKKKLIFNHCSFSGPRYGPEFVLQVA